MGKEEQILLHPLGMHFAMFDDAPPFERKADSKMNNDRRPQAVQPVCHVTRQCTPDKTGSGDAIQFPVMR